MLSWLFARPLPVGSAAPEFSLLDDSGRAVTLSALRGRSVALVFYPGDDTPGCTKQLCEFRDSWEAVRARGIEVFGVNPQSARSHARFREKYGFPFPLLVDQGRKVAALYHAGGPIVRRTVYSIGPDGVIRLARRGMPKPAELVAAVELA
jgi:peroxiredoxin Q/BCP